MGSITGKILLELGCKPGKHFGEGIKIANDLRSAGESDAAIVAAVDGLIPATIPLNRAGAPYAVFLEADTPIEEANLRDAKSHMDVLMQIPTIKRGALMPDACPSGSPLGTIPAGRPGSSERFANPCRERLRCETCFPVGTSSLGIQRKNNLRS